MFLQKLDAIEESVGMKNNYLIFNIDVEALYDSIKREHVNLAIRHAIEQCRKTWEEDFIEWLLGSINLSLDAAVAKFGGKWCQASGGVATGGKLCVYIANIVVFWAFNDVIYSRKNKHSTSTDLLMMAQEVGQERQYSFSVGFVMLISY